MRTAPIVLATLALGLASGCSTPGPVPRAEDDLLASQLRALGSTLPVRVAITPISVDRRVNVDENTGHRFPGDPVPLPAPRDRSYPFLAGQELSEWIHGFFTDPSCSPAPFREVLQYDIRPPQLEAPGEALPLLRLSMSFDELEVRFEGRNACYPLKVALWPLLVFPSVPVAAEDYTGIIALEIVLTDALHPEHIVYSCAVRAEVCGRLSDLDRGWQPFAIFKAPENLDQWNWERIKEKLAPIALRELEIRIIEAMAADLRPAVEKWLTETGRA